MRGYSRRAMSSTPTTRRCSLVMAAAACLLSASPAAHASRARAASYTPGCGALPIVYGIPPWGFHTGPPIGASGSYARGHGEINLEAGTVSGVICQEQHFAGNPSRAITMSVERHLVYHSHYATMWGYPGNIMKIVVRVQASNDPQCEVGTVGHATLFASYNGVRSDSVQFFFPAACSDEDHLYHGTQVNNQVPPL
jgi:hypothetical protein